MTSPSGVGAYGLRLEGVEPTLLNLGAPGDWTAVRVTQRQGRTAYGDVALDDASAKFPLGSDGAVVADCATGTVTVTAPERVSHDELVHPFLAWVASAFARWHGREAYHGGALVGRDGAWGITGDRGSGKSTLLAYAAGTGVPVLADDLLVVARGAALAGPRCVDLRSGAAAELKVGRTFASEGRERLRVELAPVPLVVPLRGWVMLGWGDEVTLRRVPPGEALVRLGAQRMMQLHNARPEGLLDQAALPVWELTRPRDFARLEEAAGLLARL